MKTFLRALGAAFLTAGALAVPSVAHAADDAPVFGALTEREADGKSVVYPINPGESVPVVLGVTNRGTAPSNGVVVHIRVLDDLNLTRAFTNCVYYGWGNLEGAWCEFDQELPVGGTYALWPFRATAEEHAEEISSVIFQWFSKDWADDLGGIEELAKRDSRQGTPVRGTHAALKLQPKQLPVPDDTANVGFAYLRLVTPTTPLTTTPPTTTPTDAPTSSPTTSPSTSASTSVPTPAPTTPGAAAGGAAGGLPVTGANAATVAGVGLLLVVAGGIGLVAARRRTRFTAN